MVVPEIKLVMNISINFIIKYKLTCVIIIVGTWWGPSGRCRVTTTMRWCSHTWLPLPTIFPDGRNSRWGLDCGCRSMFDIVCCPMESSYNLASLASHLFFPVSRVYIGQAALCWASSHYKLNPWRRWEQHEAGNRQAPTWCAMVLNTYIDTSGYAAASACK